MKKKLFWVIVGIVILWLGSRFILRQDFLGWVLRPPAATRLKNEQAQIEQMEERLFTDAPGSLARWVIKNPEPGKWFRVFKNESTSKIRWNVETDGLNVAYTNRLNKGQLLEWRASSLPANIQTPWGTATEEIKVVGLRTLEIFIPAGQKYSTFEISVWKEGF